MTLTAFLSSSILMLFEQLNSFHAVITVGLTTVL